MPSFEDLALVATSIAIIWILTKKYCSERRVAMVPVPRFVHPHDAPVYTMPGVHEDIVHTLAAIVDRNVQPMDSVSQQLVKPYMNPVVIRGIANGIVDRMVAKNPKLDCSLIDVDGFHVVENEDGDRVYEIVLNMHERTHKTTLKLYAKVQTVLGPPEESKLLELRPWSREQNDQVQGFPVGKEYVEYIPTLCRIQS